MAFRLEREMVEPAAQWLISLGLMTKNEFATPWGICDLVGLSFNQPRVRDRVSLGQDRAIGPMLRIALLHRIPDSSTGKSVNYSTLEREFEDLLTSCELRKEIERLTHLKFVKYRTKGRLQKFNGWAPLHEKIIAVELKINRISDALNQARQHLSFATESYVGLPSIAARRTATHPRSRIFRQEGVGILAVGTEKCEVVLPSTRRSTHVDQIVQDHCVERFWRTRDS